MCNSGPVHNTLEKFKSPALFLQEGLFSALTQHENKAFQIEELKKCRLCILMSTENILKTELFETDDVTIIA